MSNEVTPLGILRHLERVLMNQDNRYSEDEGANGLQMDDLMTGLTEWPILSQAMLDSGDPALLCVRTLIQHLPSEEFTDGQVLQGCWKILNAFGVLQEYPDHNDWEHI